MKDSISIIKKSRATAIASLVLGITSLVPLFNYLASPLSVYLGIRALVNIKKDPNLHGGKVFAVIGIIIGSIVLILSLIGVGMCLYGYKEICKNMGLAFLS